MKDESKERQRPEKLPFTVSAVYSDGLESVITHCWAADAQAARDDVLMRTGGAVLIASVFAGHLSEPDAIVYLVGRDEPKQTEAEGRGL